MFSRQIPGSAIMLSSLTNCFFFFLLQFHQKDNLSANREGDPCIYLRVLRHLSRNKDFIQTSVEVRLYVWFVVTSFNVDFFKFAIWKKKKQLVLGAFIHLKSTCGFDVKYI